MIKNAGLFTLLFLIFLNRNCFSQKQFSIENTRLDHANIAVKDLDKATAFFKKIAFTIKSGRLHHNSILNNFIKFQDGSSIELITASQKKDELSQWYIDYIAKQSLGAGAFLCLRADSKDELNKIDELLQLQNFHYNRLDFKYANILNFKKYESLHPVFFIYYKQPVFDRKKIFYHSNAANSLYAVWINTAINKKIKKKITKLSNDNLDQISLPVPNKFAEFLKLKTGYIYFVHDSTTDRIAGFTVAVKDIFKTKKLLERNLNRKLNLANTSRGNSILISPKISFGVWLEFLELN